jgi:pimeloyl-ACP methyl ester carboxylesterase
LDRKLIDFGEDVAELMKHLNIKKFHVLGISMGGPHAAAVVHRLNDFVQNVIFLVPVSGDTLKLLREKTWKEKGFVQAVMLELMVAPYVGNVFTHLLCQHVLTTPEGALELLKVNGGYDFIALNSSIYKGALAVDVIRSRNWTSLGYAQFLHVINFPQWTFNLTEIDKANRKIWLYDGAKDNVAHIENADWYTSKLPNVIHITDKEGGHFYGTNPEYLHDIVSKLIAN